MSLPNKTDAEAKLIEVACTLQTLMSFLDDTRQKRKPARDHDLSGDYTSANITSVAKSAEWLLPQVQQAHRTICDLIE